ncbi:hypothetical protein A2872_02470 [Candidatus Gottesmanbacteria bacterium RIFCSPHIGHO2_01_FULL_42_12]|uniref:Probable pectate lyase C n=1 Tax=Candidatus Gottesmanbacteria bacterium RIFCSPHIGHO2_01_FULL_42_12 TaxID=1798377 RepID=A0A1F5Z4Z5_9BACT|nr:MAG: hypothetical protein A2872_02470 [Candidatus Gottesmanbacteria bacterium RIFCSPHIGHO2_01_FULL_42_12]
MRKKLILALLFLTSLIFPSPIYAATRTVCATGCQYSSIAGAITASAQDDTISVSEGAYNGFILGKKVTITAANFDAADPTKNTTNINGQVIIDTGGSWAWDQGPIVRGFHINAVGPVNLKSPATIEYNYITGGGDHVSISGSGGIIRGNRIQNAGDDNIDIDNQSKNLLIENNYLLNAGEEGIEMRQQPSTMSQRIDVIVRGNRIEGNPSDGFQIMDYGNFSNRRYIFDRNLFINNSKGGIAIMPSNITKEDLSGAAMPEPMYVVNNTFVGNYAGIAGGANAVVINNIFSGQTGFDLKNVNGKSEIKYNLFLATPKLQGTNNLNQATTFTGNPLLTSNYTLSQGSPAIDIGIATYQYSYVYDGSGGGTAQTFTDYVINLAAGQYNGLAPDLGIGEYGGVSGKTGDVNSDGQVNIYDLSMVVANFNKTPITNAKTDVNRDGVVNLADIRLIITNILN